MPHFCPAYPQPQLSKLSRFLMFFSARRSWLDGLYERSYQMQMGEVHLGKLDLYMVNEPALVKKILVEQSDDFPKSQLLGDALRPLLGDSVLTTNGQQWQRQREMMEPAFAQTRVSVAFPVMRQAVIAMLARLDAVPDASEHDIEIEMTHVTADIIFRTIFSVPLEGAAAKQIFAAFTIFQSLAPRILLPALFGFPRLVLPWYARRSRTAATQIRSLLVGLIKPRFDDYRAGSRSMQSGSQQDILDSFLKARDPITGEPFTFEALVDQVAVLFLAGHETSASALSWALYLIAQSPNIQQRMYDEVAQLDAESLEQAAGIKNLVLTRNVFRETLRLFPPVGFLPRQVAKTCPMRDKSVKAGASVVVSPWLIHRHKLLWDQPDAFDPDRFVGEQSRDSLRNAYLPFGMGPRVCIGAAFALQEAVLILSSVSLHYRVQVVPERIPEPVGRLTIRSANGVRLVLHRRSLGSGLLSGGGSS